MILVHSLGSVIDYDTQVQNIIDPGTWIPIAAHNQYWTKKLLRKTVFDELF